MLISPEPWGRNFLSKHHIACELARRDNEVFFISSGSRTDFKPPARVNFVSYQSVRGVNLLPRLAARWLAKLEVNRILRQTGTVDIVWSFDPYRLQFLKLFRAPITIYHAVDNHQTLLEQRVVDESDIFFSNAQFTLKKYSHSNKYEIGHGVAEHFFQSPGKLVLPGTNTIKIGYVGNLENRLFNFDLLKKLVMDHRQVDFYLVGPRGKSNLNPYKKKMIFNWQELDVFDNVYWLGEQSSSSIPTYLNKFDVLLLLYNPDSNGFIVNAHKILEYLSSGKVVISKKQEDYEQYPNLIVSGRTDQEVVDLFSRVINDLDFYNSDDLKTQRIQSAKANTYEQQIDKVEMIIRAFVNNG